MQVLLCMVTCVALLAIWFAFALLPLKLAPLLLLRRRLLLLLLQALAAMVKLELPHINLLTKMDLAEDRNAVQEFLIPDAQLLMDR
jgi:hypothetical protein